MSFLKKIRWVYLLISCIPVIFGVICIVFPSFIAGLICYVAGAVCMAFGIGKVIRYFVSKKPTYDSLLVGVLLGMIGFILMFRKEEVINLVFIFIGILVLLDGIVKLKNAFENRASGARDWVVTLAVSVVVVAFGILLVADPFTGYVPIIILGIAVVVDGLQNVYAALRTVGFDRSFAPGKPAKRLNVDDFDVDGE